MFVPHTLHAAAPLAAITQHNIPHSFETGRTWRSTTRSGTPWEEQLVVVERSRESAVGEGEDGFTTGGPSSHHPSELVLDLRRFSSATRSYPDVVSLFGPPGYGSLERRRGLVSRRESREQAATRHSPYTLHQHLPRDQRLAFEPASSIHYFISRRDLLAGQHLAVHRTNAGPRGTERRSRPQY